MNMTATTWLTPSSLLTATAVLALGTGAFARNTNEPSNGPVAPVRNAAGQLVPPMGWNSYTGYSIAVTEAELLKNIDFLSERLLSYGYDTVTVDNGWFLSGQGEGVTIKLDAYGRPDSHEHFFPHGLKYTIDHAHKKGIKFGIWLLRGINRRAVDENMCLFTHPDILRCDQNGVIGQLAHRDGKTDVWKTPANDNPNNGWIGIFNRDGKPATVGKGLKDLGLSADGKYVLKDLWNKARLPAADPYHFEIPADGVAFLSYQIPKWAPTASPDADCSKPSVALTNRNTAHEPQDNII